MSKDLNNSFVVYDQVSRDSYDGASRTILDRLEQHFGQVEISAVRGPWCVRVRVSNQSKEELPLAAIGRTLEAAAERLWRISTFY